MLELYMPIHLSGLQPTWFCILWELCTQWIKINLWFVEISYQPEEEEFVNNNGLIEKYLGYTRNGKWRDRKSAPNMVSGDSELIGSGKEEKCEEGFVIMAVNDFCCLLAFKVWEVHAAEFLWVEMVNGVLNLEEQWIFARFIHYIQKSREISPFKFFLEAV